MALIVMDNEDDVVSAPVTSVASSKPLRGIPKSGRVWKSTERRRQSANVNVAALKSTWEEKSLKRKELKLQKLEEKKAIEQKEVDKKQKQKQMAEARKKKLENERRGEVVQPITDTRKLKKLSRKQWRQIRKGDTAIVGRVVKG